MRSPATESMCVFFLYPTLNAAASAEFPNYEDNIVRLLRRFERDCYLTFGTAFSGIRSPLTPSIQSNLIPVNDADIEIASLLSLRSGNAATKI